MSGQQVRRLLSSSAELAGWWSQGRKWPDLEGEGDKEMVIWNGAKGGCTAVAVAAQLQLQLH